MSKAVIIASKTQTCEVLTKQTVRITQDGDEVNGTYMENGRIGFPVESGKRYKVTAVLTIMNNHSIQETNAR